MPIDPSDAAHLMRRAGFAASASEAAALAASVSDRSGLVATVCMPAAPVPAVLPPLAGTAWSYPDRVAVTNWWYERFRTAPAPLAEKITLFWHSYFSTRSSGFAARDADLVDVYRTRGLGRFRDLLQAVAVHPAMLDFLSARYSTKWSPNQNFARETLELYTIGAGNYTQSDVVAASRAWTGWRVDDATGIVTFDPNSADDGPKTFLGVTRSWNGPEVIDWVCTSRRPQVAARLSFKMWSFFGTPDASPAARQAVADALVASDLDIRTGLTALFLHDEFWAPSTRNGLVRTPAEYLTSAMRATGVPATDVSPGDWHVDTSALGQTVFWAPNVGGWPTNTAWLSPSANLAKQAFAQWLSTFAVARNVLTATRTMDVNAAAQLTIDTFGFADRATPQTRASIAGFLTAQRATANPTDGGADIRGLVTLAILSPEFNLA